MRLTIKGPAMATWTGSFFISKACLGFLVIGSKIIVGKSNEV